MATGDENVTLPNVVRTFSALAIGALALTPITASAGASPSPETMRAALADPIERSFIEVDIAQPGTLEGPFDAQAYADYYKLAGEDQQTGGSLVRRLKSYGFVSGYGRQWYQQRTSEYLGEIVMVFTATSGASALASSSKIQYQQHIGFQSLVDPHLSKASFAVTDKSGGYSWTIVIFQKGANLFAVARGSNLSFRTDEALAQAHRAYDVAPSDIAIAQPSLLAGVTQPLRLIVVLGLMLLLAIATVVAVLVLVVFAPRAQDRT